METIYLAGSFADLVKNVTDDVAQIIRVERHLDLFVVFTLLYYLSHGKFIRDRHQASVRQKIQTVFIGGMVVGFAVYVIARALNIIEKPAPVRI